MDTADRLNLIDAVVVRPARSVDLPAIIGLFADHGLHVPLDLTLVVLNGGRRRAFGALEQGPDDLTCVAEVSARAAARVQLTSMRQLRYGRLAQVSRVSTHGD